VKTPRRDAEIHCCLRTERSPAKNAIILLMFLRSTAVFFLICACFSGAFGQTPGAVGVDSDLRLFTTLAALNAAGFDVELGAQYHPVRSAVRKFADGLDPDLKRRL